MIDKKISDFTLRDVGRFSAAFLATGCLIFASMGIWSGLPPSYVLMFLGLAVFFWLGFWVLKKGQ